MKTEMFYCTLKSPRAQILVMVRLVHQLNRDHISQRQGKCWRENKTLSSCMGSSVKLGGMQQMFKQHALLLLLFSKNRSDHLRTSHVKMFKPAVNRGVILEILFKNTKGGQDAASSLDLEQKREFVTLE